MKEFARKTFRVPSGALALFSVILVGPQVALGVYFVAKYPILLGQPVLAWMLLRPAATFAVVVLPWYFIHVPVDVGEEGIRFGWIFRTKWSDITQATIQRRWGLRALVVSRRRGFAWQAWLYMYDGLPEFLARHAPEGNPLRSIRHL
jgi:hypothetical protein